MPEVTDPSAEQSAYASRSGAFNSQLEASGSSMSPVEVPPSFLAAQARANTAPRAFVPGSVLHQMSPSNNGMSAEMASQRRLVNGAMMPSQNGSSAGTYQKSFALMWPESGGPGESL